VTTPRLGPGDAGEVLTLQRAAGRAGQVTGVWVYSARRQPPPDRT
jgi:hypothetical protein